jgi:hypothetical protein
MSHPVRIPADIDREDSVVGNLTARQLLILAVSGCVVYGCWSITRAFVPVAVFLLVAVPVGAATVFVALGRRDGLSMDRLLLAALRQRTSPRYRVAAPEGFHPAPAWLTERVTRRTGQPEQVSPAPLRLPAESIGDSARETGVIDLGTDGVAAVAVCSTVNFVLRTPAEQDALVGAFARYLHSLTAPVQILVRAERLDLSAQVGELHAAAAGLPHPALEAAAREHADYLAQLGQGTVLLRRQVLLVLREPLGVTAPVTDGLGGASPLAVLAQRRTARRAGPVTDAARHAAEARLARRLGEAADLLSPSGILVTALDAGQATAVLSAACNPDSLLPASTALAGADDVITRAGDADDWSQGAPARERETAWSGDPEAGDSLIAQHGWSAF